MSNSPQQVIVVQSTKNPGIAAFLALLFGPLGLLYVGWAPALILFIICAPIVVLTAGFGLLLTAPLCAIIGYARASTFNKRLMASKN